MRVVLAVILASVVSGCNEYTTFRDTREDDVAQRFEIKGVKADVLFYSDTSGSMERELAKLGRSVTSFIDRLDDAAEDWQLITVTGPDGCGTQGVLTPQTPDYEAKFRAGINQGPDQDEVDEWGLFNVFKAVLNSAPGQCNAGFIRNDALLHVIFLSDEADSSPGHQLGGDYWRDYVDPVLFMKDTPEDVKFSAIVGPVPGGCDSADPGIGYADAVAATDGELISICTDWEDQIGLLADASIAQSFFSLDWAPLVLEDIVVEVNQDQRLEGWFYDVEQQGIQFTDGVPGAYDVVDVYYRALIEFDVEQ